MHKDLKNQSATTRGEAAPDKQIFEAVADAAHLEEVVRFVEQSLDKYGVKGEARGHICVAIDEVATNVVMYAYPKEKGTVRVTMERQGDRIVIEIIDSGIPFNPRNTPPRT